KGPPLRLICDACGLTGYREAMRTRGASFCPNDNELVEEEWLRVVELANRRRTFLVSLNRHGPRPNLWAGSADGRATRCRSLTWRNDSISYSGVMSTRGTTACHQRISWDSNRYFPSVQHA